MCVHLLLASLQASLEQFVRGFSMESDEEVCEVVKNTCAQLSCSFFCIGRVQSHP